MVMNVFLPALTFNVLSQAPITWDLAAISVVSLLTAAASLTLALAVYGWIWRRRVEKPTLGALLLASTFANATYLGLPVVTAVVGAEFARVAVIFDLLGMSILLFTVGTMICVETGTTGTRHSAVEGLMQVIKLPPFSAAVIGILVNASGVPLPEFLRDATETAGRVVAPAMLFSIGLALGIPRLARLPILAPALVIKLVVAPFIGWLLISWLIHDPATAQATLLEAGMPTMVLTMVFAERYGLDEDMLAQAILFSTILAMATLPTLAYYLR